MTLPTSDRPEAFGQHSNAEISYLIEDSKVRLAARGKEETHVTSVGCLVSPLHWVTVILQHP